MVDLDRVQLRLQEQGVLVADLADRLRALAGLRNRLVHVHDRIDDERVHTALADGPGDLDAFAVAVARHVDAEGVRRPPAPRRG